MNQKSLKVILLAIGILLILAGVSFMISGRLAEKPIFYTCFILGAIFLFEYYQIYKKN